MGSAPDGYQSPGWIGGATRYLSNSNLRISIPCGNIYIIFAYLLASKTAALDAWICLACRQDRARVNISNLPSDMDEGELKETVGNRGRSVQFDCLMLHPVGLSVSHSGVNRTITVSPQYPHISPILCLFTSLQKGP